MQFNTYTMAGAHVAVWLVNHPDCDAAALTAELRRHDVHEPAGTADDLAALRRWTARLRAESAPPARMEKESSRTTTRGRARWALCTCGSAAARRRRIRVASSRKNKSGV